LVIRRFRSGPQPIISPPSECVCPGAPPMQKIDKSEKDFFPVKSFFCVHISADALYCQISFTYFK